MTNKNRDRVRPLLDPKNQYGFLTLGDRLIEAARGQKSPKRSALLFQTALIHELELVAPLRLRNLTMLHLERNFRFTRPRQNGPAFLVIEPGEVKNAVILEFELPARTARLLKTYLEKHRPVLVRGQDDGYLFPGAKGGHKCDMALRQQLCGAIERYTGLTVNPHLYRHIAAFFYLQQHPGDYETVRRLLGHKSLQTTVTFYAEFERYAAARVYADEILQRRDRWINGIAGGAASDRRQRRAWSATAVRAMARPVPACMAHCRESVGHIH